jgi:hypothetical protein
MPTIGSLSHCVLARASINLFRQQPVAIGFAVSLIAGNVLGDRFRFCTRNSIRATFSGQIQNRSLRALLNRLQFPTTIALKLILRLWLTCCPTAVRALHCANRHHFNLLICPNLSERRLQRFGECFDRKQSIRQE